MQRDANKREMARLGNQLRSLDTGMSGGSAEGERWVLQEELKATRKDLEAKEVAVTALEVISTLF